MKALLTKIRQVFQDFVNWLWQKFAPPVMKEWCAIFYFVAQSPGAAFPHLEPETTRDLDDKLREAIDALKSISALSRTNVHVVYRAVWLDRSDPKASVVGPFLLPPATTYFSGCYKGPLGGPPVELGKDLPCFLKWAYKWCPAKHYAIFFWGHSFGPAGLFEPGGGLSIPQPLNLAGLKVAFEEFQKTRTPPDQSPAVINMTVGAADMGSAPGGTSGAPLTQDELDAANQLLDALAAAKPHVEVVLFQDCWMSTLETAYQIKNVARYAIASQSLIPIGLNAPEFIWPYEKLLGDLLKQDFQVELTKDIFTFYEDNLSTIDSHLNTVPIALLDLSKVGGITTPLGDLVHHLHARGKAVRGPQLKPSRLYDEDTDREPSAGDAALIDVALMCETFVNDPVNDPSSADVRRAAKDLKAALQDLVILNAEAGGTPLPPPKGGFRGVSVLYWPSLPPPPEDDYITRPITGTLYTNLVFQTAFTKARRWPALEHQP
jgi:hypothetical protein